MRKIFLIILTIAAVYLFFLQTENITRSSVSTYEGTILIKPWSKSYESYCHGGSTYFTLKTEDLELTIGNARTADYKSMYSLEELDKLQGKRVILRAALVMSHLAEEEHCPDPSMQCLGAHITCEYLDVQNIKVLD
jgi:hypothetical protein